MDTHGCGGTVEVAAREVVEQCAMLGNRFVSRLLDVVVGGIQERLPLQERRGDGAERGSVNGHVEFEMSHGVLRATYPEFTQCTIERCQHRVQRIPVHARGFRGDESGSHLVECDSEFVKLGTCLRIDIHDDELTTPNAFDKTFTCQPLQCFSDGSPAHTELVGDLLLGQAGSATEFTGGDLLPEIQIYTFACTERAFGNSRRCSLSALVG